MTHLDRHPVSVPQNRWDLISVPELGGWSPSLTVSVVLPYYERSAELNRTLAGLSVQTYPAHLMQAIVVDDGSPTDPPNLPEDLNFAIEVVRQEDLGYGLTRARNLGARIAEGDVVLFLDCDMIPEQFLVEAHARWHHMASRLLTLGFRRHAEFDGVSPEEIARAIAADGVEDLFRPEETSRPEWIEAHMVRTENMLSPVDDLYVLISGGNLGIDRELYWEVGGNDESFTRWGGEDNEFAHRAMLLGAVLVPERHALAWHQGEGHEPSEDELRSLRLQRPKLESLIANPTTRRSASRVFSRPRVTVAVDPGSVEFDVLGATVDSLLASCMTDFVVGIGPVSDETRTWLQDAYSADPRVVVEIEEDEFFARHMFSPVRLRLPAGFAVSSHTLDMLVSRVSGSGVGLLHVTLPGVSPSEGMAKAWLTRAENRARSVASDDLEEEMARMFGEWWVSGRSLGLWQMEDADQLTIESTVRMDKRTWERLDQAESELSEANRRIAELTRRRSLLFANGLGQVVRARSWTELRSGWATLFRAFRRVR